MLSLERFKWHVFVATLLPVVHFSLSSMFRIQPAVFLNLVHISGFITQCLVIVQPMGELAHNFYKLAAGVHLLSLGAWAEKAAILYLIGFRHTYLVHYWMVFHVVGYFEGVRLRMPDHMSGSFHSLVREIGTNPGLGCLRKMAVFISCSVFFFAFVLAAFRLEGVIVMIVGRGICQESPCICDLLVFSFFARVGMFTAEFIFFYLVDDLRLREVS